MRSAFLLLAIGALMLLGTNGVLAQALEPIGGPYTVDANTVVLLHYDNNYTNAAAATGKTAAVAVPHATTPSKISFFSASALAALNQSVRIDNSAITDSAYITLDDTAALDMTGSWTVEAWANIFTFGDNSSDWRWVPRVVMKPGDDVFWHPNYWLEMWGDNRLFHGGYYTPSDMFISVTSPNNMFVPGEWVHLTFIRDTARAFIAVMVHDVNKNLRGFLTKGFNKATDIPKPSSQKLYMGWAGTPSNPSSDSFLDGFIDEVRVSNVVRNFAGPPVISNPTILPNQPSTASGGYPVTLDAFPLNAGATLTNVALKYRADTIGAFTTVTMTKTTGNTYTATIPAQAFKATVQYYFSVTDNNSQTSLMPFDAEATTNPTRYSFRVYQPNMQVLDLTFEEGPSGKPVDHSANGAKIVTHKYLEYSTEHPTGGGTYSLLTQSHTGVVVDSNWVEADSPFLAMEEFTLDCWIKADSADLHATRIIINPSAVADWNNANFELSFRNGTPGPVFTARYWHNDGSGAALLQDTLLAKTIHVGKWRHVIVERRKSDGLFGMRINNENDQLMFAKTLTDVKPPLMAGAPLRIGRSHFMTTDNWYVAPFRGKFDNVKVYNYALGRTAVESQNQDIPGVFSLDQNYPNPFNPTTDIRFSIPMYDHVTLVVYDLLGRQVKTLVNEERHAGQQVVRWNGRDNNNNPVASGMYIYSLKSGKLSLAKKMMLLK